MKIFVLVLASFVIFAGVVARTECLFVLGGVILLGCAFWPAGDPPVLLEATPETSAPATTVAAREID